MPINTSTVYTRERLIKFNDHMASRHKFLSILVGVCTVIVLLAFALNCVMGDVSTNMIIMLCAMLVLDLIVVLMYWVLPRIIVKKEKNLNYVINYSFEEDQFTIDVQSDEVCEKSTLKYSFLTAIERGKSGDIYLFIQHNQAYIVDTSELSYENIFQLRSIFNRNAKKFKWQE